MTWRRDQSPACFSLNCIIPPRSGEDNTPGTECLPAPPQAGKMRSHSNSQEDRQIPAGRGASLAPPSSGAMFYQMILCGREGLPATRPSRPPGGRGPAVVPSQAVEPDEGGAPRPEGSDIRSNLSSDSGRKLPRPPRRLRRLLPHARQSPPDGRIRGSQGPDAGRKARRAPLQQGVFGPTAKSFSIFPGGAKVLVILATEDILGVVCFGQVARRELGRERLPRPTSTASNRY
jgi:hypothetical protein